MTEPLEIVLSIVNIILIILALGVAGFVIYLLKEME